MGQLVTVPYITFHKAAIELIDRFISTSFSICRARCYEMDDVWNGRFEMPIPQIDTPEGPQPDFVMLENECNHEARTAGELKRLVREELYQGLAYLRNRLPVQDKPDSRSNTPMPPDGNSVTEVCVPPDRSDAMKDAESAVPEAGAIVSNVMGNLLENPDSMALRLRSPASDFTYDQCKEPPSPAVRQADEATRVPTNSLPPMHKRLKRFFEYLRKNPEPTYDDLMIGLTMARQTVRKYMTELERLKVVYQRSDKGWSLYRQFRQD